MAKKARVVAAMGCTHKATGIIVEGGRLSDGTTTFVFRQHKRAKKHFIRLSDDAVYAMHELWQRLVQESQLIESEKK